MYEDYNPLPIDTSGVVLSDEMRTLVQKLAYNQHELLVKEFKDAGWVFGDRQDSSKHTHPTIMPYSELTEAQKAFFVKTAGSIVKTIFALGYTISTQSQNT